VFGIFVAFISNYLLEGIGGDNDWRWMLGIEAIPALFYALLVMIIPNSPRWLAVKKRDDQGALKVLALIYSKNEALEKLNEIKLHMTSNVLKESIFKKKYKTVLWLAFFIAFFNQLSGINFVLYYAPEILERSGLAARESLFSSISIGVVNLIFTIIGIRLIDKLGRRQLMKIGSLGYILSLAMVGWCFYSNASSSLLLAFILIFIASHAIGQGAVIWVFISEIFPNKIRAFGQSWGTGTHWIFAGLITLLTPVFLDEKAGILKDNPWPIFIFFAFMMVLQLLWVIFKMPETKGVSLEELEDKLIKDID
jgi:sugar porter (SP) family MFS transporter